MRKIIVFSMLLLAASFSSVAQTTPAPARAAAVQYEHCILVLADAYHEGRTVHLEFGQHVKDAAPNLDLVHANAAVVKLRSVVAALNYMSSQGWECINVNTLPGAAAETGYLLRRAK